MNILQIVFFFSISNFEKDKKSTLNLTLKGKSSKNKLILSEILLLENKNILSVKDLKLTDNYKINDIGKIKLDYVDKEKFDKSKTEEMVLEIEAINKKMISEKRNYVLIGPGRWGTRDKWIGIPVSWPQISNAKIIVETSLKDYPLEASSGSHFFHNVTSMNVGYFSIQQEHSEDILKWDVLKKQKLIDETKYFKHVQFENPLKIMMDGKKRISVILE